MFAAKDPNQLNPNLKKAADNQILLGILGELKSKVLTKDKSFDSITTISDEFFNILIHLLQFSSQIYNTIKKRQSYDKLLPKVKSSLSDEISSFFDTISNIHSNSKQSTSLTLNVSTETSFTLCNTASKESIEDSSFLLCEELSNENIIEKIKKKIEQKTAYPTSIPSPKASTIIQSEKKKKTKKANKAISSCNIKPIKPLEPLITEEPKEKKTHHASISQPKRLSTFTNLEMINSFRDKLDQSQQSERLNTSYSSTKQEMIMKHCLNLKINQNVPKASHYANYLMNKYKGVIDSYNSAVSEKRSSSNSIKTYPLQKRASKLSK